MPCPVCGAYMEGERGGNMHLARSYLVDNLSSSDHFDNLFGYLPITLATRPKSRYSLNSDSLNRELTSILNKSYVQNWLPLTGRPTKKKTPLKLYSQSLNSGTKKQMPQLMFHIFTFFLCLSRKIFGTHLFNRQNSTRQTNLIVELLCLQKVYANNLNIISRTQSKIEAFMGIRIRFHNFRS
ncbi:hypothetical protein BpHYR1_003707 [Brachionus plicatilis]|uniref:Uncharacterized protein n=1 Tax=Brachionus plicatilis TaxID=10195 RepID=A0A3M7REW3_BRAPC|nr:hypothetical protein BpHYR1_003707 [Brachionus plicatilis]